MIGPELVSLLPAGVSRPDDLLSLPAVQPCARSANDSCRHVGAFCVTSEHLERVFFVQLVVL